MSTLFIVTRATTYSTFKTASAASILHGYSVILRDNSQNVDLYSL